MEYMALAHTLGKVSKPWVDKDGKEHISYTINIIQNNGEIIDSISVSKRYF